MLGKTPADIISNAKHSKSCQQESLYFVFVTKSLAFSGGFVIT